MASESGETTMNQKKWTYLAWLLAALITVSASVSLFTWVLNQTSAPTLNDLVNAVGFNWALPVLFSLIGALIIASQPRNRVGWLLMLPALEMAVPTNYSLATARRLHSPPAFGC